MGSLLVLMVGSTKIVDDTIFIGGNLNPG